MIYSIKATREGLVGNKTASGFVIDRIVPYVALPSRKALGMFIRVRNPLNDKTCLAVVLDIGPWNEHDDDYVFGGNRPKAETGLDDRGRVTNRAGIDLGEAVWRKLDMRDNTDVAWEFVG